MFSMSSVYTGDSLLLGRSRAESTDYYVGDEIGVLIAMRERDRALAGCVSEGGWRDVAPGGAVVIDDIPKRERLSVLRLELEHDRAWTNVQLVSRYGRFTSEQLLGVGLLRFYRVVPVRHGVRVGKRVAFWCCSRALCGAGDSAVQHAVGVAGARHLLEVPLNRWVLGGRKVRGEPEPDAVWVRGEELVAVEYDFGTYSRTQVREKALRFVERFDDQVWVCPTPGRAEYLRSTIEREAGVAISEPLVVSPYDV